jgi:hypothetical protein
MFNFEFVFVNLIHKSNVLLTKQQNSYINNFMQFCSSDAISVNAGGSITATTPSSTGTDLFMCLVKCGAQPACVAVTVDTTTGNCNLYSNGSFSAQTISATKNLWKKNING